MTYAGVKTEVNNSAACESYRNQSRQPRQGIETHRLGEIIAVSRIWPLNQSMFNRNVIERRQSSMFYVGDGSR